MGLSNYDRWLLPSEGSGTYDATCKARVVYCGCTGEPTTLVDVIARRWLPFPRLFWHTVCASCLLADDLDADTCGETWTTGGNWMEGAGVELTDEPACPACGNDDPDTIELDEHEWEPDYEAIAEARAEARMDDSRDVW